MFKSYVLGFMFEREWPWRVVLIRKNRPEWQSGKLNGVGGHIEPGEEPVEAMEREFREETGVDTTGMWTACGSIKREDDFEVFIFKGVCSDLQNLGLRSVTDELVYCEWISQIHRGNRGIIPNLAWIIPLLLDDNSDGAPYIVHMEVAKPMKEPDPCTPW